MQWHERNILSKASFVSLQHLFYILWFDSLIKIFWFPLHAADKILNKYGLVHKWNDFWYENLYNFSHPFSYIFTFFFYLFIWSPFLFLGPLFLFSYLFLSPSYTFHKSIKETTQLAIMPFKEFHITFFINFSCRVLCKCSTCGSKKQALAEWERHTGCTAKKWKHSVKVEGTMQPLIKWVCVISC